MNSNNDLINDAAHIQYTEQNENAARGMFEDLIDKMYHTETTIQWNKDRLAFYDGIFTFNGKRFMIETKHRVDPEMERYNDVWIEMRKVRNLLQYREEGFNGSYIFMFEPIHKRVYVIDNTQMDKPYKTKNGVLVPRYLPNKTLVPTDFNCYLKSKLKCYNTINGKQL
jgi:hypothetical protein